MKEEDLTKIAIDYACTLAIEETRKNCEKVQKMNVTQYEEFVKTTIDKILKEIEKIKNETLIE